MDALELIKAYLIPGTPPFLILGLTIGVGLLFLNERLQRWGRIGLLVLAILYWGLSAPLGARLLESGLSAGFSSIESAAGLGDVDTVVVLGGGSVNLRSRGEVSSLITSVSALRAMEGSRLYNLLGNPLVVASGGRNPSMADGVPESELLAEILVQGGVPRGRILTESLSQNTREQARELKSILEEKRVQRFILVTSPIHMKRSLGVFRAYGLDPIPGVSSMHSEGLFPSRWGLLPTTIALDASAVAIREYMATVYYQLRGWFRPINP